VVLFQHSAPSPDEAEAALLTALGVRTVRGRVAELVSTGGRLTGVRLGGGTLVGRDAVVVQPRSVARSELLVSLGLALTRDPSGAYVPTTRTGLTAVPGVWAAGNVTDPSAKVVTAAAAGLAAAMDISNNLILGDATSALLKALPQPSAAR
jgi:thioredoxin reductase